MSHCDPTAYGNPFLLSSLEDKMDRADLFTSLPRSNPRFPGPGLLYPINGRCKLQIVLVSVVQGP